MAIRDYITCGRAPIERALMPFQVFFQSKATGGILLIVCAVVAMTWANSPWSASYEALWHTQCSVGFGTAILSQSLHHWINDGLMAVFFFVVGLEIKREFMVGELSTRSQAVLPFAGAIGGMVVPAAIYALVTQGTPAIAGWGVPMATDIAFALGLLSLLGDRIPYQLKIFLTAVAIVDDIGGIMVIAFFYTSSISLWMLAAAAGLLLVAYIGNRVGVRHPVFYAFIGCIVWLTVLKSGIHSTVAGVAMAFMIPARTRCKPETFVLNATNIIGDYSRSVRPGATVLTNSSMHSALLSLQHAATSAQTPLQRLEYALHPVVDYAIMPLFALANAGVMIGGDLGAVLASPVTVGTLLGLVLGKPIGITLAVACITRLSGGYPKGMGFKYFLGASMLAGIGFTMSLFIAALAFADAPGLLIRAKTAILLASMLAGLGGYLLLRSIPLPASPEKS